MSHHELHKTHRSSWLRASVMGANDGIVSTASLIIGVAAAEVTKDYVLISGLAGLVAGAMSMAAGEYVSVSSQSDIEKADLEQERLSLEQNLDFEKQELAEIYEDRGLSTELAKEVAEQLMEHDALGAHARDCGGNPASADHGRAILGNGLYHWRVASSPHSLDISLATAHYHGGAFVAGFPGDAGRCLGKSGRRSCAQGCDTRYFLGGHGDAGHGYGGPCFWYFSLG